MLCLSTCCCNLQLFRSCSAHCERQRISEIFASNQHAPSALVARRFSLRCLHRVYVVQFRTKANQVNQQSMSTNETRSTSKASSIRLCLLIRAGKVVFLDKLRPASTVHSAKCLMNAGTFQWAIQHASVQFSFSIAPATDLLPDTGCARNHALRHNDTAKIPHLAKAENSEPAESCPSCLPLQVLPVRLSQEAAAGGAAAAGQHEHFKQDEQPQQHQTQSHKNHYCNHRHCHKHKYSTLSANQRRKLNLRNKQTAEICNRSSWLLCLADFAMQAWSMQGWLLRCLCNSTFYKDTANLGNLNYLWQNVQTLQLYRVSQVPTMSTNLRGQPCENTALKSQLYQRPAPRAKCLLRESEVFQRSIRSLTLTDLQHWGRSWPIEWTRWKCHL